MPKGARRAVLWTDLKTGGDTYYAHFPAGTHFEPHWHAYAEYAVVLRGKVIHTLGTQKSSLDVGDYVVIPPRVAHAWDIEPGGDAFLLIPPRRSSRPEFRAAVAATISNDMGRDRID